MTRTLKQIAASRINGAKSKGPKTVRGKAVASKNATKHGLIATVPPLLATEDLESFEGIMNGLVEKYQPSDPIAWHLVQVVAMSILKQHRLWAAEAALLNAETINPPKLKLPYNYFSNTGSDNTLADSPYHPKNLTQEENLLSKILELLAKYDDLDSLRQKYRKEAQEFGESECGEDLAYSRIWSNFQDDLKTELERLQTLPYNPFKELKERALFFSDTSDYFLEWRKLSSELEDSDETSWSVLESVIRTFKSQNNEERSPDFIRWIIECNVTSLKKAFSARLHQILKISQLNQEAIEKYSSELEEYNQTIAPSKLITPNLELLMRYETHNTKQLMKAVSKLEEHQQFTKNQ